MGGQELLRIVAGADSDIRDSLRPLSDGGTALEAGFADSLEEKYDGAFRVEILERTWATINPALLRAASEGELLPLMEAGDEQADVFLFSIRGALECELDVEDIKAGLESVITTIHEQTGAHVLVFNCSSVDLSDDVYDYRGIPDTFSLRALKLNHALIELSMLHGVSIIDVERLVAQLGGERHLSEPLRYSTTVFEEIRNELLRVLEDIGFFEERPLVMQVGRKNG